MEIPTRLVSGNGSDSLVILFSSLIFKMWILCWFDVMESGFSMVYSKEREMGKRAPSL